jgi:dethiobiotin synthetase
MKTLLVTGTDTGVGKTWITSLLVRCFRQQGINIGAYKPVCSGAEVNSNGEVVWADIEALRSACGTDPEIDLVCPQRFHAAVAPNIAAKMENRLVDSRLLIDGAARWESHVDQLIIEGAGGIFCPLSDELTVMDVAVELNTPTIVVAANRLGVINHTRLTVEALQTHGVNVVAIVLNEIGPASQENSDPSGPTNAAQIRHWLPKTPLFHCSWRANEITSLSEGVSLVDFLQ